MTGAASRAIAGCFALAAFAVAVLAGLAGGNTAVSILTRAILAMVICYPVGLVVGLVCQHVIEQHIRQQTAETEAAAGSEQSAKSAEEAEDVLVV